MKLKSDVLFKSDPLIEKLRKTARWIRRHGLRAYLTFASVEEACGRLTLRTRFFRAILG